MTLVIDLIDLVAKHKSGELRCPATALIVNVPLLSRLRTAHCKYGIVIGKVKHHKQNKQRVRQCIHLCVPKSQRGTSTKQQHEVLPFLQKWQSVMHRTS